MTCHRRVTGRRRGRSGGCGRGRGCALRGGVLRDTMMANYRLTRLQLAAASADHVALRQIHFRRVSIGGLLNRILASLFLDGGRQRVAAIQRREAIGAMPLPGVLAGNPVEVAFEIPVGLIKADVARLTVSELDAPVRIV